MLSLRVEAESSTELFSCSFKPSFPFFLFLILTRLLVRIKGTNVPFHSLPKPCLPTQLEPSKMPDQIIPWEKYYDDSQVRKALRSVGSVWILADTAVSILTDCICLWPPDSSAAVTGLD